MAQTLHCGRWRQRLAEHRTWSSLAEAVFLRQMLHQLDGQESAEDALADWLAGFAGQPDAVQAALPALLRAGQAWAVWERAGPARIDRLPTAAVFSLPASGAGTA